MKPDSRSDGLGIKGKKGIKSQKAHSALLIPIIPFIPTGISGVTVGQLIRFFCPNRRLTFDAVGLKPVRECRFRYIAAGEAVHNSDGFGFVGLKRKPISCQKHIGS